MIDRSPHVPKNAEMVSFLIEPTERVQVSYTGAAGAPGLLTGECVVSDVPCWLVRMDNCQRLNQPFAKTCVRPLWAPMSLDKHPRPWSTRPAMDLGTAEKYAWLVDAGGERIGRHLEEVVNHIVAAVNAFEAKPS